MISTALSGVRQLFLDLFGLEPLLVQSPGRVNLLGEHTDYNMGFVLPMAIDKTVTVAVSKRTDSYIYLFSEEGKDLYCTVSTRELEPVGAWPDAILGVVDQLYKRGLATGGFNILLTRGIPDGAGLSSSVAVGCAAIYALTELFGFEISLPEMAKLVQAGGQRFTGTYCSMMDPFVTLSGRKDTAVRLDCRTLEYEYIPFRMEGYKIVLFNSPVESPLTSSGYRIRRAECAEGVKWVSERYPKVMTLRDVTLSMLDEIVWNRDSTIYSRCKYVIEENIRVQEACERMKKGNIISLGSRMFESHRGLRDEYGASCKDLDFLVDSVWKDHSVIGARMMEGGSGAVTINLVREKAVDGLAERIAKKYKEATGLDLTIYVADSEEGTRTM